ncbi:MAG: AAA family ATPase [Gemmatimonadales bacterium]
MTDQARELRALAQGAPVAPTDEVGTPVYVVASGKGGVGKSVLATLLADGFAAAGARVLLVDGAQNLGHLNVLTGVAVGGRLEQVLRGETDPASLVVPVTERLWLLPSDSGAEALYALPAVDQARLHHRLAALYADYDLIVVDAGAGIETVIRLATMGGTRVVLVTVPEVAALTDSYAVIKLVHAQLPGLPIDVVVNRAVDPEEVPRAFERLSVAAGRFLGRQLNLLGGISEAPGLREAMRRPGGLFSDLRLEGLRREVRAMSKTLARSDGSASVAAGGAA